MAARVNPAHAIRSLNLTNKIALAVGGTKGIGAAVAQKFASLGAGVILVGRDQLTAESVIQECKDSNETSDAAYDFVKADLSTVRGMKDCVKSIESTLKHTPKGKIDYIIQTQGGTPTPTLFLTSDGIEHHFAIQLLSRFTIPYLLKKRDLLSENCVVVIVASPGGSIKEYDLSKMECLDIINSPSLLNIPRLMQRDQLIGDGITAAFNNHPNSPITTYHLFPGFVDTKSYKFLGSPFVSAIGSIFGPILARTPFGSTPQSFSPYPVYLAAHPDASKGSRFRGSSLNDIKPNPWATNQANQQQLYTSLRRYLEKNDSA